MYDLRTMDRCLQVEVAAYLDTSNQYLPLLFDAAAVILISVLFLSFASSFLVRVIASVAIVAALCAAGWSEFVHDRALDRVLECT